MASTIHSNSTLLPSSPSSPAPCHFPWVETLRSHARSHAFSEALRTYVAMTSAGAHPDYVVFPAAIKSATGLRSPSIGRQLHAAAVKHGYLGSPPDVSNTLIVMYATCGDTSSAAKVFDRMLQRDAISWTSMISALCASEDWEAALQAFRDMQRNGFRPDAYTIVSVAPACSNSGRKDALHLVSQVHGYALRNSLYNDGKIFLNNSLLAMYTNLGMIEVARSLFYSMDDRDCASWNTMISSLVHTNRFSDALVIFHQMVGSGIRPDSVTLTSLLLACSHLESTIFGKAVHAYALRDGHVADCSFVGNALVDMYAQMGEIGVATEIFRRMECRDTISWNTIIMGYMTCGSYNDAFRLLVEMQEVEENDKDGGWEHKPDSITLNIILSACASLAALGKGKEVHAYALRNALDADVEVSRALVDMYAKSRCLVYSRRVFDRLPMRNVGTWNVLVKRQGDQAVERFIVLLRDLLCCVERGLTPHG